MSGCQPIPAAPAGMAGGPTSRWSPRPARRSTARSRGRPPGGCRRAGEWGGRRGAAPVVAAGWRTRSGRAPPLAWFPSRSGSTSGQRSTVRPETVSSSTSGQRAGGRVWHGVRPEHPSSRVHSAQGTEAAAGVERPTSPGLRLARGRGRGMSPRAASGTPPRRASGRMSAIAFPHSSHPSYRGPARAERPSSPHASALCLQGIKGEDRRWSGDYAACQGRIHTYIL